MRPQGDEALAAFDPALDQIDLVTGRSDAQAAAAQFVIPQAIGLVQEGGGVHRPFGQLCHAIKLPQLPHSYHLNVKQKWTGAYLYGAKCQ